MNGKPVSIQANKLITIKDLFASLGYNPIDIVVTFYALKNEVYLVNTRQVGHGQFEFSILKVTNESSGNIKYTPVPFVKRELETFFLTNNTLCTDEAVQKKLSDEKINFEKEKMTKLKEILHPLKLTII